MSHFWQESVQTLLQYSNSGRDYKGKHCDRNIPSRILWSLACEVFLVLWSMNNVCLFVHYQPGHLDNTLFVCLYLCLYSPHLVLQRAAYTLALFLTWIISSSQQWPALQCSALFMLCYCATLHCTALHCTALHCPALHCTDLHSTALHCTALHWPPLH